MTTTESQPGRPGFETYICFLLLIQLLNLHEFSTVAAKHSEFGEFRSNELIDQSTLKTVQSTIVTTDVYVWVLGLKQVSRNIVNKEIEWKYLFLLCPGCDGSSRRTIEAEGTWIVKGNNDIRNIGILVCTKSELFPKVVLLGLREIRHATCEDLAEIEAISLEEIASTRGEGEGPLKLDIDTSS